MPEENYWVSLENAKLLKELGYDVPCKCRFPDMDSLDNSCMGIEDAKAIANWNATKDSISVPTFEEVRQWTRAKYKIGFGMMPSLWGIDRSDYDTTWFFRGGGFIVDGADYNKVYNKGINKILKKIREENKN